MNIPHGGLAVCGIRDISECSVSDESDQYISFSVRVEIGPPGTVFRIGTGYETIMLRTTGAGELYDVRLVSTRQLIERLCGNDPFDDLPAIDGIPVIDLGDTLDGAINLPVGIRFPDIVPKFIRSDEYVHAIIDSEAAPVRRIQNRLGKLTHLISDSDIIVGFSFGPLNSQKLDEFDDWLQWIYAS